MLLALVAAIVLWAVPSLVAMRRGAQLRAAAFDLASQVRRLRHEAAARSRRQALHFERLQGRWRLRRIVDGNRNGVRSHEIHTGVDPSEGAGVDLMERWGAAAPGLPPTPIPRLPPVRGVLQPGSDPLQLSGTDRVSCAPDGACTGGTVYLNAGGAEAAAVVIYGGTGRVRVWRYAPSEVRWIPY